MKCNIEENRKDCPCTYMSCSKRGKCCECIKYHLKRRELPACCFPSDVEKTYDRTFEKFIEVYSK
ncbi:MAG: hypothetical protein GF329_11410 [Candidatus Lokiarchaeota archaeon]|nr:hypothetical protein [Candidatus Lokiarchaeota archaeon]